MSQPRSEARTTGAAPAAAKLPPMTLNAILLFWLPLAAMWLIMGVEGPAVNAVMSRLPMPDANLAAFGVVLSLSLVVESPIIQMLSAATAVVHGEQDYRRLLGLMNRLAIILTTLHLAIAFSPLYPFVTTRLLGVPGDIAELGRVPFVVMAPFSAAVGYRRLWQGVLIRFGHTGIVSVTMVVRIAALAAALVILVIAQPVGGAMIAAIAIIAGVLAGAIAAGISFRHLLAGRLPDLPPNPTTESPGALTRFYVPLALTSVVFLAARPLLTVGITRSLLLRESLAAWPVIQAFLFLFNSVGLSLQEAVIALIGESEERLPQLRRFVRRVALVLGGVFLLVAVTPLRDLWFSGVAGLGSHLLPLTSVPLLVLPLAPMLASFKSLYRGLAVHRRKTIVLTESVVLYTASLLGLVLVLPLVFPMQGTTTAAVSLVLALAAENLWLRFRLEPSLIPVRFMQKSVY